MKENSKIIPLRTILQNCLNHIDNLENRRTVCDIYEKEFQELKQFSESLKDDKDFSCTEGEKDVNKKKNRYKDILPFNVSRVVLSEYGGSAGSDYINANYIKGASGSPAYIASQGPLPNTVNDFWRMIVECEVQVIVMACNAEEAGKHKCENYWVEKEGEERRFGMVEICLVKASTVCPDFLVRTMRLKYTNVKAATEERTVCQFHYSAWPDHGVPPLVRPLLDMVRLVRDTQASETLPVLVHCSAGCGRTGTICAIDFVWGLLRAGKLTEDFSLFNLVKDMRKQRIAMVQTKEQYILVHQAVRELFKEQLRVIESHPYENIDLNGVPLLREAEEPLYDIIEDHSSPSTSQEECHDPAPRVILTEKPVEMPETAPPLPRKKRQNIPTKEEKEVENLTEKRRTSGMEREGEESSGSSPGSTLRNKPRIARLKALFERSPSSRERAKHKNSQAVARSHSMGPVRKPLLLELPDTKPLPPQERNVTRPQAQPIPGGGKLKVPKLPSASVPRPTSIVQRSKSLKAPNQSSPVMSISLSVSQEVRPKYQMEAKKVQIKKPEKERVQPPPSTHHILQHRRRSLESLMGDEPPTITWPTTCRLLPPTIQASPRPSQSFKHQLQNLTLEANKRVQMLVSGLGVRERRNSFRQAISREEAAPKASRSVNKNAWPDLKSDSKRGGEEIKTIHVDGSQKNLREHLTVRSQNGEILKPVIGEQVDASIWQKVDRARVLLERIESSGPPVKPHPALQRSKTQVIRRVEPMVAQPYKSANAWLESKNRFLQRLNHEIQEDQQRGIERGNTSEAKIVSRPRQSVEDGKSVDQTDAVMGKKKNGNFLGIRTYKPTSTCNERPQNFFKQTQKRMEKWKDKTFRTKPSGTSYINYEERDHCPWSPPIEEDLTLPVNTPSERRKHAVNYSTSYDLYATINPKSNGEVSRHPQEAPYNRLKFSSASNSLSSHSSGDLNDYGARNSPGSEQRSSPRVLEEPVRLPGDKKLWPLERVGSRASVEQGSESSSSSGARELFSVLSSGQGQAQSQVQMQSQGLTERKLNYGIVARVKLLPSQTEQFNGKEKVEPVAPVRIKKHSTTPQSRYSMFEASESPKPSWPVAPNQFEGKKGWNDALGVDLDKVAASMQSQKVLVPRTTTSETSTSIKPSVAPQQPYKKQQHYL